jgi:predicted amidophosphoribosyltransferase
MPLGKSGLLANCAVCGDIHDMVEGAMRRSQFWPIEKFVCTRCQHTIEEAHPTVPLCPECGKPMSSHEAVT